MTEPKKTTGKVYKIPVKWATTPRDGECLVNRHWIVTIDNELLLWNGTSPQCNRDIKIASGLKEPYMPCVTRFIPAVYLGHQHPETGIYGLAVRSTSGIWENNNG